MGQGKRGWSGEEKRGRNNTAILKGIEGACRDSGCFRKAEKCTGM